MLLEIKQAGLDGALSRQYPRQIMQDPGLSPTQLPGCRAYVKPNAYSTMVRPILEYAATVWDPYQQTQIQMLEGVQGRAARFVKDNYLEKSPGCVTSIKGALH